MQGSFSPSGPRNTAGLGPKPFIYILKYCSVACNVKFLGLYLYLYITY